MSDDTILIDTHAGVTTLTLNRPNAMNALTPQMLDVLVGALSEAQSDESVRVVVLTGAGRAFCAGADLKAVGSEVESGGGSNAFLVKIKHVLDTLRAFPKPVIAAINGTALAGGLEIAMCSDIIVAAETAKIGDAHLNFGVIPGGGGAAVLPRLVGPVIAKRLLFTGDMLPASELIHTGLLAAVWPAEHLAAEVAALAERIAAKSPLGLRLTKELVDQGLEMTVQDALALEIDANATYSKSEDMAEGMRAFSEKRKPVFTGR